MRRVANGYKVCYSLKCWPSGCGCYDNCNYSYPEEVFEGDNAGPRALARMDALYAGNYEGEKEKAS